MEYWSKEVLNVVQFITKEKNLCITETETLNINKWEVIFTNASKKKKDDCRDLKFNSPQHLQVWLLQLSFADIIT